MRVGGTGPHYDQLDSTVHILDENGMTYCGDYADSLAAWLEGEVKDTIDWVHVDAHLDGYKNVCDDCADLFSEIQAVTVDAEPGGDA